MAPAEQDIEEVLAAGIDVISTVNIQHLESLNDSIAELTEVRVRETFPDHVLEDADEVVLVPVAPPDDVPIPGVDHHLLARAIAEADPDRVVTELESVDAVPDYLLPRLEPGDVAVCMGIGDIYRAAYLMADASGAEVLAG